MEGEGEREEGGFLTCGVDDIPERVQDEGKRPEECNEGDDARVEESFRGQDVRQLQGNISDEHTQVQAC